MKHCILLAGLLFSVMSLSALEEGDVGQPKMRPVDRNWAFYKNISCDQIDKVVFHSRSEEMLVAKRKAQCLDKYKAFFSNPVEKK